MGEPVSALELARRQIVAAREYTLTLLADLEPEQWLQTPGETSSIAWQVGHLAMAEYGLCMFRIRGRRETDLQLMSGRFRKQFSRGSTPPSDPARCPSPEEIRQVFDRVHQQALEELAAVREQDLAERIEEPHVVFDTKLGALFFCAHHEMLHAGQIGLLRRWLGKPPLR